MNNQREALAAVREVLVLPSVLLRPDSILEGAVRL
jgi:hypothetical protein